MQGHPDDQCGGELGYGRDLDEGADIGEHRPLIGNHLHRTGDHQPTRSAEKAADHGKWDEPNSASSMSKSKDAQKQPGEDRGQGKSDESGNKGVGAALCKTLNDGRHHRGQNDGN